MNERLIADHSDAGNRSLIGQLREVAETGLLPDGSAIDTAVMLWLERIIKPKAIAAMGESAEPATVAAYNGQTESDGLRSLPSPSPANCEHAYVFPDKGVPYCYFCGVVKLQRREIYDDNYMTVVFDRSVVNFDMNPMHIKSEFGNVVAISRGDALSKLDAARELPKVPLGEIRLISFSDIEDANVD